MTLTQLEIFSLVAELQGFTSAANRLGISQSAVSHAIKSLEQELGVELIDVISPRSNSAISANNCCCAPGPCSGWPTRCNRKPPMPAG